MSRAQGPAADSEVRRGLWLRTSSIWGQGLRVARPELYIYNVASDPSGALPHEQGWGSISGNPRKLKPKLVYAPSIRQSRSTVLMLTVMSALSSSSDLVTVTQSP